MSIGTERNAAAVAQIATNIRAELERQGLSEGQLAERMGIPLGALVGRLENRVEITGGELMAVCRALDVDPSVLLDGVA